MHILRSRRRMHSNELKGSFGGIDRTISHVNLFRIPSRVLLSREMESYLRSVLRIPSIQYCTTHISVYNVHCCANFVSEMRRALRKSLCWCQFEIRGNNIRVRGMLSIIYNPTSSWLLFPALFHYLYVFNVHTKQICWAYDFTSKFIKRDTLLITSIHSYTRSIGVLTHISPFATPCVTYHWNQLVEIYQIPPNTATN